MRHKLFMPVVRELLECARAFERCSSAHVRTLQLTPAQFDIIATLGNTEGMTCKELGEKTLITKGTLTGVLDRLEGKGLVERTPSLEDGRSWITRPTRRGQALFEEIFPAHIKYLQPQFDTIRDSELETMRAILKRLREAFDLHTSQEHANAS